MELNEYFWKHGYAVIDNFVADPQELDDIPDNVYEENHTSWYYDGGFKGDWGKEEQVPGAHSRHNYPPFRNFHKAVVPYLQRLIKPYNQLVPTYYFDRFYHAGEELVPHTDWSACEISVSLQISTTLKEPWAFYAEGVPLYCNNGDAIIYKGNTLKHWREAMPGGDRDYHHQIFLHYVVKDGECHKVCQELQQRGDC